uniref:Tetraspanin n=1 Tax=Otus sunia TaxID=257818 RepID=A0A8C8ECX4_9STRI
RPDRRRHRPRPEGTMTVLKLSLMAFSFVFWAAGLTMLIIGLWARVSLGSYLALSANDYPSAPAILLATGAAVLIWGFLGCFGAATEHRGLLRDGLRQALLAYGEDEGTADALDALQRTLSCCGVESYRDWLAAPWGLEQNGSVPLSCCRARRGCRRGPPEAGRLHRDGCFSKVSAFVSSNMFYVATAAVGLALLQLIGIVLACLSPGPAPAPLRRPSFPQTWVYPTGKILPSHSPLPPELPSPDSVRPREPVSGASVLQASPQPLRAGKVPPGLAVLPPGSRSPLEPLDRFCREWWQHGQTRGQQGHLRQG